MLLTVGRGLREAAATGEMAASYGSVGWLATILGLGITFLVFVVLPQTRLQTGTPPGSRRRER